VKKLKKKDILYPELSYRIIGAAFDVYNILGAGYHEKYYQRALAQEFEKRSLSYGEQVPYKIQYKSNKDLGINYLDFLIEDKIIVEIKKGNHFSKRHIDQVLNYLKTTGKKLAIIINFGTNEVSFKRIINIY